MWKTLTTYVLLASSAFAKQQVFNDVARPVTVTATSHDTWQTTWPQPGKPPSRPVIDLNVQMLVQRLMQQAHIPGISIGVVRSDNFIETGSWGIRSENRDRMTTDVSFVCY